MSGDGVGVGAGVLDPDPKRNQLERSAVYGEPVTIRRGTPTLERWRSVQLLWFRSVNIRVQLEHRRALVQGLGEVDHAHVARGKGGGERVEDGGGGGHAGSLLRRGRTG